MQPASWKKTGALKLCRFGKYLTKHVFQCKCVFILYFHLFCNKGMYASWSLGGGGGGGVDALAPAVFCGNSVATCTKDRRPWIWIWIWMENFISTASLAIATVCVNNNTNNVNRRAII